MGDAAVVDMKGEPVMPHQKQRKKRETIRCIEDHPRPDWFIQGKGPDGRTWWFLRVSITGMRTRIYGQVRQLLQAYEEAVQRGESPVLPVIGEAETEIMQEVADQTTQPVSVVWRIYGAHLEWNALTAYGDEIGGKS